MILARCECGRLFEPIISQATFQVTSDAYMAKPVVLASQCEKCNAGPFAAQAELYREFQKQSASDAEERRLASQSPPLPLKS